MKRISLALSTFFLFVFIIVSEVNAEAAPIGYNSSCLTGTPAENHVAALTFPADAEIKPKGDTKTYIFVCITLTGEEYSALGTLCTTADLAIDKQYKIGIQADGSYGLEKLRGVKDGNGNGVVVKGTNPNPAMTNGGGTAFTTTAKWEDHFGGDISHQWAWLQLIPPIEAGSGEAGSAGAQQQGTFDWAQIAGKTNTDCAKIVWDPRGYVFDATTLHPVKDIWVTLSKGTKGNPTSYKDLPTTNFMRNPDKTEYGQFTFMVEPGFYKLRIDTKSETAASISDITKVNSTYQDLFLTLTGDELHDKKEREKIYQKDQEIEEVAGAVALKHIPATVTDPTLLITTLQTIRKDPTTETNGMIHISGAVSHPKSKIILTMNYQNEAGNPVNMVKTGVTDELGEYDLKFLQSQVNESTGESFTLLLSNLNVSLELNSYYTTGTFSTSNNGVVAFANKLWNIFSQKTTVNASTRTSFDVKPIPTYIEGIAYDANKTPIPGAIVGVYPFYSGNPMYTTIADETGRYKIGSQHLPRFEYKLRYKKPTGEVVVVDTGTFIKQNIKFFATEGIKPFAEKKTTLAEDKKVQDFFTNTNTALDLNPTEAGQKNSSNNKYVSGGSSNSSSRDQSGGAAQTGTGALGAGMQGVIMIVVVIMVLVMIGVGAFIMMKSKQQTPQY